jgi:hypothetical protein
MNLSVHSLFKYIMRRIFTYFLFFLLITALSCDKKNSQPGNPVPYVKVSITVYLSDPANTKILTKGESILVNNAGNKGIIVTHDADDNYWAFDRTCPYHINSACGTIVQFGSQLVCGSIITGGYTPCCESTYNFSGGDVTHGPSTYGLKKYTVGFSGSEMYITN